MSVKQQFEKIYPLSPMQLGMLFHYLRDPETKAYCDQAEFQISGQLDPDQFEASLNLLIHRHQVLRTNFVYQKIQTPRQVVFKGRKIKIYYEDIARFKEKERLSIVRFYKENDLGKGFNLTKDQLMRVAIFKTGEESYKIIWSYHHIIMDGWCLGLLFKDLIEIYQSLQTRVEANLDPVTPYSNYIDWLERQNQDQAKAYWQKYLAGYEQLAIPLGYREGRSAENYMLQERVFDLESAQVAGMERLAQEYNVTISTIFQAVWGILLQRYNGVDDVIFGAVVSGRPAEIAGIEEMVGIFINNLPVRVKSEPGQTFCQLIQQLQNDILASRAYEYSSLADIQGQSSLKRELLNHIIVFENFPVEEEIKSSSDQGLSFQVDEMEMLEQTNYDFNIYLVPGDGLKVKFVYNALTFHEELIRRMESHLQKVIQVILDQPELPVQEIQITTPEEEQQIRVDFNQTQTALPEDRLLTELIEAQVEATPDQVALIFEDQELTYRELNTRANQLATQLRQQGVKPDTLVGLMVERSSEMLVGMLAIRKAGGAYLPMDPTYPKERIRYMLADSGAQILLTQRRVVGKIPQVEVETLCIDDPKYYQGHSSNLPRTGTANQLAYLIYTSGSTGKPKGVMLEDQSVVNFIQGMTEIIDFAPGKRILALTSISFDISVLELLLPLTRGMTVVIGSEEKQRDTRALSQVITRHEIQMLQMTPSRLRMLLNDHLSQDCLQDVQEILVGGEAFPQDLLQEIKGVTRARIYNMYGPTETTVWSAVKELTQAEEVTIGRPIANTAIYMLGANDQLQPLGVPGELCIGGAGLARGYLERPELTASKFIPNPFLATQNLTGASTQLYRTGDVARWLPTGEIEFLGRLDQQVKIRGHRIELGEIESHLSQHSEVVSSVVVAKENKFGDKSLCAYLEATGELSIAELKEHLAKELPDYMIPAYFIQLDGIPMTPNGKVDRKALPEPEAGSHTGVEYTAPTNDVEEKLIQIWELVLGIDGIGIHHNYFDIGGNSINIIKVISLINKELGQEITLSEIFLRPTIAELAENLFAENPLAGLECVVSLNQARPEKKNIFILHNQKGIIYQYKELAKLLESDCNFYGVQARGLIDPKPLPETLEDMVTEYIREIKKIQPEGPYIIGGYCYGTWLVYKMAEMMEARGVEIDKIIMIDENAYLPDNYIKFLKVKRGVSTPFRLAKRFTRRKDENPMENWPEIAASTEAIVEGTHERTVEENICYMCEQVYLLKSLVESDIHVIKAEDNMEPKHTAEDWRQMCAGQVSYTEIPGDHWNIFSYPYVEKLAATMGEIIHR